MRKRHDGISIPMKYKANTDYKTIPDTLRPNALALYTARTQGLSDFSVMISSDFTTAEMNAIFGVGNHPTAGEIAGMKAYKGKETWAGLEPVVINPNDKYYWPDRSGNNRHLHLVNLAYDATGGLQAGPPANYLFDGVNDYAVYNSATDIVAANGAVSAFVVFQAKDTVASTHRLFYFGNASTGKRVIGCNTSTTELISLSEDTTSGSSISGTGTGSVANTWYSAYAQYDPSVKKAGVRRNVSALAQGNALTNGTAALTKMVLSAALDTSAFANDRIAEVYLFNKVLTQAEITQLHNNIASRYGLTKV